MSVEQQDQEIIIRLPSSMNVLAVRKIVDYFRVMDVVSQSGGTEEEANELAHEVERGW